MSINEVDSSNWRTTRLIGTERGPTSSITEALKWSVVSDKSAEDNEDEGDARVDLSKI